MTAIENEWVTLESRDEHNLGPRLCSSIRWKTSPYMPTYPQPQPPTPPMAHDFLSLTAPLRWWPSWKMAAILKFQVAVGGLLSSDPLRLLMPISMLVSPNKPLYHVTAPLRCRPSWKRAAILKFQVAVGGLLSSDPQGLLMPIVMLVSPNKPLYDLTAQLGGGHLEKWPPSWNFKWLWVDYCQVTHRDCSCQFPCLYHQINHYIT